MRNVTDRLPDAVASTVAKRMRAAYRNPDPLVAQEDLEAFARELGRAHSGASGARVKAWPRLSPSARSGWPDARSDPAQH